MNNVYGAYNPLPLSSTLARAPHTRRNTRGTTTNTLHEHTDEKKYRCTFKKRHIQQKIEMKKLWRLWRSCGDGCGCGGDGDDDGGGGTLATGGGGTGDDDRGDGDGDGSGGTAAAQHARGQYMCAGRLATYVRAGREGRGTRLQ